MLGVGRDGPVGPARATRSIHPAPSAVDVPGAPVVGSETDAWVVLACTTGIGPVSFARLVASFGSADAVLRRCLTTGSGEALVAAIPCLRRPHRPFPAQRSARPGFRSVPSPRCAYRSRSPLRPDGVPWRWPETSHTRANHQHARRRDGARRRHQHREHPRQPIGRDQRGFVPGSSPSKKARPCSALA